jgi:hypothetical protein
MYNGQSPVNTNCGCYLITVNGGQEYSITEASFTFPTFNEDVPPITYNVYNPTYAYTYYTHYESHRLSFSGFENDKLHMDWKITEGSILTPGCDQGGNPPGCATMTKSTSETPPFYAETYVSVEGEQCCNTVGQSPPTAVSSGTIVGNLKHAKAGTYKLSITVNLRAKVVGSDMSDKAAATLVVTYADGANTVSIPAQQYVANQNNPSPPPFQTTITATVNAAGSGTDFVIHYIPNVAVGDNTNTVWARGIIKVNSISAPP